MDSRKRYLKMLESKGFGSNMAVDAEGYFSPSKMQQILEAKKTNNRRKFKSEEDKLVGESLKETMAPIEKEDSVELRKKYSDAVMKRLKKNSPRT